MASDQYHEPVEYLSKKTKDLTRMIKSVMEEFEAVDWYNQRMDATDDETLKAILKHNRDEELEHLAMGIEWLRRQIPELDSELKAVLFKDGPIIGDHGEDDAPAKGKTLKVGTMKGDQ